MRKILLTFLISCLMVGLSVPSPVRAQRAIQEPVRAVFFYSPTCPHCHEVIEKLLIPMMEEYGDTLQVLGIDTTKPAGSALYQAAVEYYQIPQQRLGVPTMIVDDIVLVGSGEIPERFPTIVDEGLASGGIAWPTLPALAGVLPPEIQAEDATGEQATASTEDAATENPGEIAVLEQAETNDAASGAAPLASQTEADDSTIAGTAASAGQDEESLAGAATPEEQTFGADMILAWSVLIGMFGALSFALWRILTEKPDMLIGNSETANRVKSWVVPALSLAGLGIAIYLAYVEITLTEAVCGPIGQCNTVQSSRYARILGVPVAVMGIVNYLAILALWTWQRYRDGEWSDLSVMGLVGLTFFGTFFSIYLTWLEISVIHAVCIWCISSAILTTILMLVVVIVVTAKPRKPTPRRGRRAAV